MPRSVVNFKSTNVRLLYHLFDRLFGWEALAPRSRSGRWPMEPRSDRHQVAIWDWPGHLAVWSWGRGPVLLLLHGPGGGAGDLTPLFDPLVAAGYRAVAPDLPGHGDSDGDPLDLPARADAVAAIARLIGPVRAIVGMADGLVDYRLDADPAALEGLLAFLDDGFPAANVA